MQRRAQLCKPAGLILATALALIACPAMAAADTKPSAARITSHFFRTSDGARLHYLQTRPATTAAQVIVLVPGWSMPASLWQAQLHALGQRHRVIALDPRGQGRSQVTISGYHIDRRADDLRDLLSRYRRVVLAGWSLGALEVLHYVHRHGDKKLAALVLVDSSVGEGPPGEPSQFAEALRHDRHKTLIDFVGAIFKTPPPADDLQALVKSALRMPLKASLSLFPSRLPREHWRNIARGFSKPLLYVVTPQFAGQAQELKLNRPGTRTEVFEQAGHALFVDEPERFSQLLLDFLENGEAPAKANLRLITLDLPTSIRGQL